MGYGTYDARAYRNISSARTNMRREEIFSRTSCHPDMDPKGLEFRESRDSEKHPKSIGVMFALDETGSMMDIPDLMAREELPKFMETILKGEFVDDPQVLILAFGDADTGEDAPLQVGQFESEAELMDKWLTNALLVGGGGGNDGESYDLVFYVAARHTAMDCWEKRGKKGYLFVMGDEPPFNAVYAKHVKRLIGDGRLQEDIPLQTIINEASKTFHPFFLVPDQRRRSYRGMEQRWRKVLGDRVICLDTPKDACLAAATLIGLTERALEDLTAARAKLLSLEIGKEQVDRILSSVEPYFKSLQLDVSKKQKTQKKETPSPSGKKGKEKSKGDNMRL